MHTILLQQLVQVQQLSAALRGRAVSGGGGGGRGSSAHPSSSTLVAQALASAESAAVMELRAQLSAVQSELATREEQYELSLRSYQQQYERLKLQYEVWRGQYSGGLEHAGIRWDGLKRFYRSEQRLNNFQIASYTKRLVVGAVEKASRETSAGCCDSPRHWLCACRRRRSLALITPASSESASRSWRHRCGGVGDSQV